MLIWGIVLELGRACDAQYLSYCMSERKVGEWCSANHNSVGWGDGAYHKCLLRSVNSPPLPRICKGERFNIDIDLRARKFKPGEGGSCDKVGTTPAWLSMGRVLERAYQLCTVTSAGAFNH